MKLNDKNYMVYIGISTPFLSTNCKYLVRYFEKTYYIRSGKLNKGDRVVIVEIDKFISMSEYRENLINSMIK